MYDRLQHRIVASCISCPGTGELWLATHGEAWLETYDIVGEHCTFASRRPCNVWQYDPAVTRPTVYVDNPNPFTRRGVDMLRAANLEVLDKSLRVLDFTQFRVGSNGLHHCLVASGGPVVGSITTSIGGIQDLGGILMVQNAGGYVAAFRLTEDRQMEQVGAHTDILMDGGYDFLVTAIDREWLAALTTVLQRSLAV